MKVKTKRDKFPVCRRWHSMSITIKRLELLLFVTGYYATIVMPSLKERPAGAYRGYSLLPSWHSGTYGTGQRE